MTKKFILFVLLITCLYCCENKSEFINLDGIWYYVDKNNNYVEIYFKDSLILEHNELHTLSPIMPFIHENNNIYIKTKSSKNKYFKIEKTINDSTLRIKTENDEKYILRKIEPLNDNIVFPNLDIYDSLYDKYMTEYLKRSIVFKDKF